MQDLFAEFSNQEKKTERLASLGKAQKPVLFSTNLEQMILAGIVLILTACLLFFLGVLRGKSLRRPAPVAPTQQATVTAAPPASRGIIVDDPQKPYTIQLVTHRRKDMAEQEAAMLRRAGFFSTIIPSGPYYQVCAGQYSSREDADRDLRVFISRYKDRFLRRRPA